MSNSISASDLNQIAITMQSICNEHINWMRERLIGRPVIIKTGHYQGHKAEVTGVILASYIVRGYTFGCCLNIWTKDESRFIYDSRADARRYYKLSDLELLDVDLSVG